MLFGYFDPDFFWGIIKIGNFPGELADVSAKKEALAMTAPIWRNR